ncbi:MAG TPA: LysM peptidoglycan-binding domain-containing protein [Anaerolineales bacterium]|nr:LysM peptidoglycan-binding domain-containing protein [Anaerolineales bacterium]
MKKLYRAFIVFPVLFALILPLAAPRNLPSSPPLFQDASPTPKPSSLSPADLINVVNDLRLSEGLNVLSVHSVLMDIAALQASALAATNGTVGHQRPCGMTLGQQMLVMGFPLWGDLSLDGYRSENWAVATTVEQVISSWLGDAEHTNTMLSPERSHIGAAVAVSDQVYVVLETALSTPSGQHQSIAPDILTSVPMTQAACAGLTTNGDGSVSQYAIPVAISTAKPDGDVIHEVQYGQTLWSIAVQYNTTIAELKRLNNLPDDTISPGWKLLIQKGATQPALKMDSPLDASVDVTSTTETKYPTAIPFFTTTPTITATVPTVPLGQQIKRNSTVIVSLLIAFSILLAGIIGFGKKKEE